MDVEELRKQYLPEDKIKVLFIAEAKPDADDRFFYYDKVKTDDYLYLHMMYALYDKTKDDKEYLREHKADFLNRFKENGYYLIDAVDRPTSKADMKNAIKENADKKVSEIEELISQHGDDSTKIVIIKATVFDILYSLLKDKYNVINDNKIYFPSTGREPDFMRQMGEIIEEIRK